MAKSARAKRNREIRAQRREAAAPLFAKQEDAKQAALEKAAAAPKVAVVAPVAPREPMERGRARKPKAPRAVALEMKPAEAAAMDVDAKPKRGPAGELKAQGAGVRKRQGGVKNKLLQAFAPTTKAQKRRSHAAQRYHRLMNLDLQQGRA